MRLVAGRPFGAGDEREATAVAIVSESFVRAFLPDREPWESASLRRPERRGGAALGLAAGLLGALALTRLLVSQLFGLKPTHPATFLVVSLLLAVMTLLASRVPARRAAAVQPVVALRED